MSVAGRGIRNAFRNATRTVSITLILGLAIGLAFVMLIAHRAVGNKASTALSSVGNTVTIGPPGYSAGGKLGKFLTRAELAPIARLHGVAGINESLNGATKASDLPPSDATGAGSSAPKIVKVGGSRRKVHGSSASVKLGSTSLKYPGPWRPPRRAGLRAETLLLRRLATSRSTSPARPSRRRRSTSGHRRSRSSAATRSRARARRRRHDQHGDRRAENRAEGRLDLHRLRRGADRRGHLPERQPAGQRHSHNLTAVLQRLGGTDKVFSAVVSVSSLDQLSKVTSRSIAPLASGRAW